jgi:hypothetical protein
MGSSAAAAKLVVVNAESSEEQWSSAVMPCSYDPGRGCLKFISAAAEAYCQEPVGKWFMKVAVCSEVFFDCASSSLFQQPLVFTLLSMVETLTHAFTFALTLECRKQLDKDVAVVQLVLAVPVGRA